MGEIKRVVLNSLVRGFLPEESFEQRIEGSEECAIRLSGRRVLGRVINKRKTPIGCMFGLCKDWQGANVSGARRKK